jgi:hypothetical protein
VTNTKEKSGKEERVQIKTRQPGPVQPSGFSQLRRHADLNSVDTVAEILSLPTEATAAVDPDQTRTNAVPVPDPYQSQTGTGAVPTGFQSPADQESPDVSPPQVQKVVPKVPRPKAKAPAAPERDFGRVANSITRDALPQGAFPGSSKKIYDVLYLRTRAAVTPVHSVRATRRELMRWTGIKDIKTVNAHIKKLIDAGLLIRTKLAGEHEGSIYEVMLPEEANQYQTRTSTRPVPDTDQSRTGAVPEPSQKTDSDQYQNSVRAGSGHPIDSIDISGAPKTSFKTTADKIDDDAFAGLIALLRQATGEVTGKEPSAAERERWTEVGELLIAELKQGAARTTVSSVPAFLTEHLRRRLSRQPAPPPGLKPPAAAPASPPAPPTDDELVEMFTGFLHQGMTLDDLDGQLSSSIDAERWPRIRAAALERYEREREQTRPPTTA